MHALEAHFVPSVPDVSACLKTLTELVARVSDWVTAEGRFYPDGECSTRAGGSIRNKLTSQAPGFHIIDHVIWHTSLDTPELVTAEGLECATRASLSMID